MSSSGRAAFAIVLAAYLLLSLLVFNQIEEDAFIDLRQAGNLVDGYGFVFNRGGERIEAASSLLWVFLLVVLWSAPVDVVITAKLLGLACGCVALCLVLCLSRRQISDPVLRFGPPLLTVASVPFLMWSQRGLETPLLALLVLWLALCWTDTKWFRWWPAAAVLLLLTRPEGPLFLLALPVALGFDRCRWRAAMPGIAVVAATAIVLLLGRFLYFHDFVPSPFYVKLHTGGGEGLDQIRKYLVHNYVLPIASPFLVVGWRSGFWDRRRGVLLALLLITTAWCALAKDYMPYTRHLVPAIPLLYVLVFAAADRLLAGTRRLRAPLAIGYVATACVLTLLLSRATGAFTSTGPNALRQYLRAFAVDPAAFAAATVAKIRSPNEPGFTDYELARYDTIGTTFQSLAGQFLRRNYPPRTVVVYDQMGQTPFYAGEGMRFVDSLGLTDRTVGRFYFERWGREDALLRAYDTLAASAARLVFGEERRAITAGEVLDYLFAQKPDVILIHTVVVGVDPDGIPALLSGDPRLARDYELRYTLARFILGYERRDLPRKRHLDVPAGILVVAR